MRNTPIKDIVILVAFTNKEITEEFAQIGIVRLIVEAKSTSVIQEDAKLGGAPTTQDIRGSGHLLLQDTIVVPFLHRSSRETLPGKSTPKEVNQDVSKRFEVIATSWLDTQMSVDGGVAVSSSGVNIPVFSVRDVNMGLGVTECLGKTEIDDIDLTATLPDAYEEVVRFDIAVNQIFPMDVFGTRNLWQKGVRKKMGEEAKDYQLISKEKNGLETKFAVTEVEEILQRRPEEIENHGVVVTFCAKPSDKRNTDTTSKGFVDLGLLLQLRVLGVYRL